MTTRLLFETPQGALLAREQRVRYFTWSGTGRTVPSVLHRQPANLTDTYASVYAAPKYDSNDNLIGGFTKIGGPVNVSGGWFDAGGGYEKFGFTASYTDALLLLAARDSRGPSAAALRDEAEFGLRWVRELWNPAKKVVHQVGINGNAKIDGDLALVLPRPGPARASRIGGYYVSTGRCSGGGAGRAGQPRAGGALAGLRPRRAARPDGTRVIRPRANRRALLALARSVYAMAKTTDGSDLWPTFPHDYCRARGIRCLGRGGSPAPTSERRAAGTAAGGTGGGGAWARPTSRRGTRRAATPQPYDNGAVAEANLRAMRDVPGASVIAPRLLLADMAAQLRTGEKAA